MGPRVRVVLVVLSLLAVAALAVPLALSLADRRTATLAAERERQLASLADAAAMPNAPLDRLVDRYHQVYREGLVIVDSDGQALAGQGMRITDPGVADAATHALVDAPQTPWARVRPWDQRTILTAAGVRRDGEVVGAVVMAVSTETAARDVATSWMWVAIGCAALIIMAAVAARGLTRWVLRPLDGLERAVADMTEGVAGPPVNVSGPPELRHFTAAFNTMAQVVRASLDRQRRLVADASHQLRNPLAAVRLRADSLADSVTESGRATYRSMSTELDRLENLLQQLLRLARAEEAGGSRQVGLASAAAESTDLADVIDERFVFWTPMADRHRQRLQTLVAHPGPLVALARHDVEQLLDVAVDNAVRYAGSGATITAAARSDDGGIDLIVSDSGQGLPDEDLERAAARFWRGRDDATGTGLGLAIAGAIATGHGGSIAVEKAPEGGLLIRYRLPDAGETC